MPKDAQKILVAAQEIIKNDIAILSSHFGINIPQIEVKVNSRMTRYFGKALLFTDGSTEIEISKKIFKGKTHTLAFKNTVQHELAHVAEHFIYGDMSDHGKYWLDIMNVLGAPTDVFVTNKALQEVNFDIPRRDLKKYTYKCDCMIHKVGGQVHNNIIKGRAYLCQKCNTSIRGV